MRLKIFLMVGLVIGAFGTAKPFSVWAAGNNSVYQLSDALRFAYENNPSLKAARAELKAVHEKMPQAMAGWKPLLDASGNITNSDIDGGTPGADGTTSKGVELAFNQPLYRGGRTIASMDAAQESILAQRAALKTLEQEIMLSVATSYMDVLRDASVLELSKSNEHVIAKNLEATKDRFNVGDLTRTDVAQAQARLAKAEAETIRAKVNLEASKANYEKYSGPVTGIFVNPILNFAFPETLEEAVALAERTNPRVDAARHRHQSAKKDVGQAFGELLPEMALFGSWDRELDPQPGLQSDTTTKTIGISASIPLYQAGAARSRVRQVKHTANQRYLEILESQRDVRAEVIRNWENLRVAEAEIDARKVQAEASKLAREGVRQENELGSRSVLDSLDADQEYLDAQVELVSAERNKIVATFSLAATLGLLTPENLGTTDFSQQFEQHLETIKSKILGIDIDYEEDKL